MAGRALERRILLAVLTAAVCLGQQEVTLEQAGQRGGADFAPALEGKDISVKGIVESKPIWALDSYYVPIVDKQDFGLLLHGPLQRLDGLAPGDAIAVTGTLIRRGGMPFLLPRTLEKTGKEAPPRPKPVPLADLAGFRYLGVVISTEGTVQSTGFNAGGDLMHIADRDSQVMIFLPKARRDAKTNSFTRFSAGDRVRVTGLASQYCPLPPYDRSFQIMVSDPTTVTMVQRGAIIPPFLLLTGVAGISLILVVWWLREHRMAAQRKAARSLNTLSEQIIAAGSPGEILRKLATMMPEVSGATGVRFYIYNRRTRMLDRVTSQRDPEPLSVNIESPVAPLATGAALAFRNRSLLNIPDTRRSPFFKAGSKDLPRSVMFVPMFTQGEVMGVLEIAHSEGIRYFTHEEQAAAQHLANQVATSLKLQEQQSIREQLFRSEKLAAAGQLISGVASELRSPLESILGISKKLAISEGDAQERDIQVLSAEARRAAEIVARLVSFGRMEESEAKPVEIHGLLTSLIRFREREWKLLGIHMKMRMSREPLYAIGAQGQLEQVFLNLLVHSEQCVLDTSEKMVSINVSAVGKRVLVEMTYAVKNSETAPDPLAGGPAVEGSALALGVSRGIVHSHGGDIRFSRPSAKQCRFEVDLPLAPAAERRGGDGARARSRQYTTMVVEPDAALCRQIVNALSARNHRVVPVTTAEEGVDLVQRLKFDAVLCSMRLPGLNWVEFFERVRGQASAFVLLTESYDPALSRAFSGAEGFVLSKPLNESELDRVLADVEERADQAMAAP